MGRCAAVATFWALGAGATPVHAAPPVPITAVTRQNVVSHFREQQSFEKLYALAKSRQWKPSARWLATEGKKYGTVLVVSDTHPGPGVDPVTGKTAPAEDFMRDRQELDFRSMLEQQWSEAKADGKTRTLVLNGDAFEFMQTSTTAEGKTFKGKLDKYGPLNTARNIRDKLDAIREGHPALFETYVDHLRAGHRLVVVPGNHDRQLQHPAVRARLRTILTQDLAAKYEGDASFAVGTTGPSRRAAAIQKARAVMTAQYELVPHFFLIGDVWMQHGHQNDAFNSFSTLLGSYYARPMARDAEIEGAMGDYIVKALYNEVEARVPWGDNDSKVMAAFKALAKTDGPLKAAKWLITKLPPKVHYIMTREGNFGPEAERLLKTRERAELGRMVEEFGLVGKLNELRGDKAPLDAAAVVDLLVEYQSMQAKPVLSYFKAGSGLMSRLATAVRLAPTLKRELADNKRLENEERAVQFLFGQLGIQTHATGHDHEFRSQRYIVGEKGQEKLGQTLDDATWTDGIADRGRTTMATGLERRGVIRVTFDATGSVSELLHWDPARKLLAKTAVLAGDQEALIDIRENRSTNKK